MALLNFLYKLSTLSFCVTNFKLYISKFISSTKIIKFTNSTGVENVTELSIISKRDRKILAWSFFVPDINQYNIENLTLIKIILQVVHWQSF